jgi:flagellar assembly protein FliH
MSGFDPIGLEDFRIIAAADGAGGLRGTARILFEEDFAAPPAARRRPDPPPEPDPPPPGYSEAELEEARRAAFREGRDAGRTAARAEAEAAGQAALAAIAAELAAAAAAARHAAAEAAELALRLVLGTLAALHPSLSEELAAADIAAMAAALLPQLGAEPRLTVRLCPPLAAKLEPVLRRLADEAGFQGEIAVRPDPAVAPDGATLSWSAGAALRDPPALRRALLDLLAPLSLGPIPPENDDAERPA